MSSNPTPGAASSNPANPNPTAAAASPTPLRPATAAAAPAGAPAPASNRKRTFLLGGLALAVLIAGGAFGAYYYLHGRFYESTDDAYANGNVVQITPQIAGTIVSIGADDNALVNQGQLLVKFDASDAEVGLASADAALARAVRQVRGLYSNVGSLDAEVASKRVALNRAQADLARRQDLVSSGAIPAEELAHARENYAAAATALNAAQQQANTSRALVDDTGVISHPDVLAAAAMVRKSYLDHLRSELQAPVTGYVAQRSAQVGQRVQAGTPLMAVVPLEQLWVDANFKETQMRLMRIGQPVTLRADLYGDDVVYHGKVAGLGVGTGSAFSLLPAQNATGNWIKIVQRVPVRIALDPAELKAHPLRLGLSMNVEVDMHDTGGQVLAQTAATAANWSTDIYQKQLAEADERIHRIIEENSGPMKAAVRGSIRDSIQAAQAAQAERDALPARSVRAPRVPPAAAANDVPLTVPRPTLPSLSPMTTPPRVGSQSAS